MFKRIIPVIIIITLASAATYYYYYTIDGMRAYSTGPFPISWDVRTPQEDTAFGGLFYGQIPDDSLPHYRYRIIQDSIKRITDSIEMNNKSIGDSRGFAAISLLEMTDRLSNPWDEYRKDTVYKSLEDSMNFLYNKKYDLKARDSFSNIDKLIGDVAWRSNVRAHKLDSLKALQQGKHYYLGLNNYDVKEHHTRFFVKNGTCNLAYVVWDYINKRTHDSTEVGHYEQKKIRVRYSAEDKRVYIPLTKQQYRIITFAVNTLLYGSIFLIVYFFIGIPILIIISIANGNAFTIKNIRRFRLMALVQIINVLITIISPYFFRTLYHDMIPEEIFLAIPAYTFITQLPSILIAAGIFLISKAFQRGLTLQQENALTI